MLKSIGDTLGKNAKERISFLLTVTVGMLIYAIGVVSFTVPNGIVPGGFTSIATIINEFTGFPIGVTNMLMNIPVGIIAWKLLSKKFVYRTIIGVLINSVTLDLMTFVVRKYGLMFQDGEPLLAAIFGGIIMGIGSGMAAVKGSTSGGSTALGAILQTKNPAFEIGRMTMFVNMIIVVISIFVYGKLEAGMYAIICIFTYSKVMDTILLGVKSNMLVFIIADDGENIKDSIRKKMKRGMTIIEGKGGYTNDNKEIIMCVVAKNEYSRLKKYVKNVDSKAFMVTAETGEVVGSDFKTEAL